jgi:hypothetical protein
MFFINHVIKFKYQSDCLRLSALKLESVGEIVFMKPNSMQQTHSLEADNTHVVKMFPTFYGNRKFLTAFTRAATGAWPKPFEISPHPHTIFVSVHRSSKWSLRLHTHTQFVVIICYRVNSP